MPASPQVKFKTYSWQQLVKQANRHAPEPIVYPFANSVKSKKYQDYPIGTAIYGMISFVKGQYSDLTANNATLSQVPFGSVLHALKIVDAGDNAGAHIAFFTEKGQKYAIEYQFHNNNDGSNHSLRVYDGDQAGFGSSEPSVLATTGALDAVTSWAKGILAFTANSPTTTLAIWNEDAGAGAGYYHDIKYKRITA